MNPRVVIVGGGFGGLRAAQSLKGDAVQITLIDRRNYHLFQPLLYQVATGSLSPANISAPLRNVLKRQRNVRVLLAEVQGIDVQARQLQASEVSLPYDWLIVATGSENDYFGHDSWATLAPGLKTIEDATSIRARIISAFEAAERDTGAIDRGAQLTFVVVGGGPTGVELAGAVAELARDTLRHEFRSIAPERARIILMEAAERLLATYSSDLSTRARHQLESLGVTVRVGCAVEEIHDGEIVVRTASGRESLAARTVLWSAGMRATPVGAQLSRATGVPLDRAGRVHVDEYLSLPGYPEIFVIGDLAHVENDQGSLLPAIAPVALQEGHYVARQIRARLAGRSLPPFRFKDRGQLATIGRSRAVAELPHLRLWGWPAWVIWLFVHLMQLVRHENRVLVFIQWMFNYFTRNRSARLITEENRSGDYSSRETFRNV